MADGLRTMPELKPYFKNESVTLYLGDCLEVMPQLDVMVDAVITDPPYGINASQMTMGKSQSSKPKELRLSYGQRWDILRPDISSLLNYKLICIWGGNYFTDILPITNDWLVWHKKNDDRSFSECELAWTNFGCNTRHLSHHWSGEEKVHITQKPLAVMQWCIGFLPNEVSIILDPFMGSGTTLVAAQNEGRRAIGIEISEDYCKIAIDRLRQPSLFSIVKPSPPTTQPQQLRLDTGNSGGGKA